jgi:predicted MPP superfamily phosphohydrolase
LSFCQFTEVHTKKIYFEIMKIIAIGDTHGRDYWLKIVEKHSDADKIIFIGDYVDTHDNITGLEQVENLRAIIDFKLKNKDQVELLVGNHCHHYWPGVGYTGTSGYQAGMKASFEYEFETYKHLFQMAYTDGRFVFSHAGITQFWLADNGLTHLEITSTVDQINDLFRYQPLKFHYYMQDSSGYGENPHQSPIWVRPDSLRMNGIKGVTQVVGHTMQNSLELDDDILFIDTLGTSKEYLIIEDGVLSKDVV